MHRSLASSQWTSQRERGNRLALEFLKWVALGLGRRAVHCLLVPVVSYFVLFSKRSRQSSADYLKRVLNRRASWKEIWLHFYTFAIVSVDRLYFLADKPQSIKISLSGEDIFKKFVADKQGCILVVSHIGSFDVMRAPAIKEHRLPIRILMDKQHNAHAMAVLEALSPELTQNALDARLPAPELSLKLDQCLKKGEFIGIMADRVRVEDKSLQTVFLGGSASLPVGPWLFSMVLKVPVVLCFGIYKGKGQYDVSFELVDQHIHVSRKQRQEALRNVMDYYACRMEYYLHQAPYNWFNFFEFWSNESSSNK